MKRVLKEALSNIGEVVIVRLKLADKRSLQVVNEHFKPVVNASLIMQCFRKSA